MPQKRPEYLKICRAEYFDVSRARWGKAFNLEAVEEDVKKLRDQKELRYEHLEYFRNQDHWWFKEWWTLPPKDSLDLALKDKPFEFWQLSRGNEGKPKEADFIRNLFSAFKSIELVSIILRFIRPESYGILSPPTERMLDVRRGNDAVETYLHYLDNLRRIRDAQYGLDRVADVDMALWVLHARCFDGSLKNAQIQQEYCRDPFMLQLRAENLFSSIAEVPLPLLAQAIQRVQGHLAAMVACHFFEFEVRRYARLTGHAGDDERSKALDLCGVIDKLARCKKIDPLTKGRWHRLRQTRNDLIHGGQIPATDRLGELIMEALKVGQTNQSFQSGP